MFSWSTKLIINQADWQNALLKDLKKNNISDLNNGDKEE